MQVLSCLHDGRPLTVCEVTACCLCALAGGSATSTKLKILLGPRNDAVGNTTNALPTNAKTFYRNWHQSYKMTPFFLLKHCCVVVYLTRSFHWTFQDIYANILWH